MITIFTATCGKADIAFIVDASGSINFKDNENWNRLLKFLVRIVSQTQFNNDTRFAFVCYSDDALVVFDLDDYDMTEIATAVMTQSQYKGAGTNIAAGLRETRTKVFSSSGGDRSDSPNVAILISDGEDTLEMDATLPEAELLRQDAYIITVAITDDVDLMELSEISSSRSVLHVEEFSRLNTILKDVLNATCVPGFTMIPPATSTIATTSTPQTTSETKTPSSTVASSMPTTDADTTTTTHGTETPVTSIRTTAISASLPPTCEYNTLKD